MGLLGEDQTEKDKEGPGNSDIVVAVLNGTTRTNDLRADPTKNALAYLARRPERGFQQAMSANSPQTR